MTKRMILLPDINYLEECFDVEYGSGIVTWKNRPMQHFSTVQGWGTFNSRFAGKIAGSLHKEDGYVNVFFRGKSYRLHRIIYKMYSRKEIPDNMEVDHLDGNRSNNCITNLCLKISKKNARNRFRPKNNSSGVIGVQFMRNRNSFYWQACWTDLHTNKRRSKYFSILQLGYDRAFELACEYRVKKVEQLNAQGAGYTERHGK